MATRKSAKTSKKPASKTKKNADKTKKNAKKSKKSMNKTKKTAKKASKTSKKPASLNNELLIAKVATPSTGILERMHKRIMDSIQLKHRAENVIDRPENIHMDVASLDERSATNAERAKPVILLIHAEWCGHCRNLMPQWNEMSEKLHDQITIKKIESSDLDHELNELDRDGIIDTNDMKQNVIGYPTIGSINNKTFTPYQGGRSTDELVAWADSVMKSLP